MKILGIDTAIPTASVALIEDGTLLAEEAQRAAPDRNSRVAGKPPSNHAEAILPLIESLFEKAGIGVTELSGVAVSIGPGSFTGLRIGLATAKGLAYDSGLPLVGIPTLTANAARVNHDDALVGSMLDARKSQVYFALFYRTRKKLERLTPDAVLSVPAVIDLLQKQRAGSGIGLIIVGEGAAVYRPRLVESLGSSAQVNESSCLSSLAAQIGLLANDRLAAAASDDVGTLAPIYLRVPEAEQNKKNSPTY